MVFENKIELTLQRSAQAADNKLGQHACSVEESPGRSTFGGLPYEYLPTMRRQAWERAITGWSYPLERDQRTWARFVQSARRVAKKHLLTSMQRMLVSCSEPGGIDGLVLDNLPHPFPGPTPTDGRRPEGKTGESEAVILGVIYAALCAVLGYLQEKDGDLIHQVAPVKGQEAVQSNSGRTKFGWHVDNAFLRLLFQPQYLALFGLINEQNVPTLLLSLESDILPALTTRLLRRLRTAMFLLPAPHSFDFGDRTIITEPRPVIYNDEHGIDRIALPRSDYVQPDPVAAKAICELRELLDSLTPRTIIIKPGRLLVFSNSRHVHARSAFTGERWLQRAYFSNNLTPHRAVMGSGPSQQVFDASKFVGM